MTISIGQVFLILHLFGAIGVGLLTLASFVIFIKRKVGYYKPLALNMAITTCFQLIIGSFLALSYQNSE